MKYLVFVRPTNPVSGAVMRNTPSTDLSVDCLYAYDGSGTTSSDFKRITGDPWILFAAHDSLEDARLAEAKAINALGEENVKLCKVL